MASTYSPWADALAVVAIVLMGVILYWDVWLLVTSTYIPNVAVPVLVGAALLAGICYTVGELFKRDVPIRLS